MPLVLFNPLIGPLSGATTPGQSGPGSNGNEGVLRIPQSSSIAGTSPSDCLVSYPGHSLGGGLTPLQRSSRCILQSRPTGQLEVEYRTSEKQTLHIAFSKKIWVGFEEWSGRHPEIYCHWIFGKDLLSQIVSIFHREGDLNKSNK